MKKTTLEFKYAVHCLGVVSNYTVNRRPVEELHPAFEKEMVAIIAEVQQEQAAELSRLRAIETAAKEWRASDCAFFVNGVPTSTPELQARFEKACKTLRDALEGGVK